LTIGIIIDAVPSMKLKIPPAIPISLFGASNETNTQVIEVESNNPDITGTVSEQHCGIKSSFYKNRSVPCGD
jgi:hypothetical protein